MAKFSVHPHGTDPNGRTLLATDYMWAWWLRVCDDLGFAPTIVQGAFMSRGGGGASASAGYHDQGGCFDLRTWDLLPEQVQKTVRTLRAFGAAAWLRDAAHGGFDSHIHFVLGTDRPLHAGAAAQWVAYLNSRDGLAGNGPDYHWRPSPLVTKPPEEDDMADPKVQAQLDRIESKLDRLTTATTKRLKGLREKIATRAKGEALDDLAADVDAILAELADE